MSGDVAWSSTGGTLSDTTNGGATITAAASGDGSITVRATFSCVGNANAVVLDAGAIDYGAGPPEAFADLGEMLDLTPGPEHMVQVLVMLIGAAVCFVMTRFSIQGLLIAGGLFIFVGFALPTVGYGEYWLAVVTSILLVGFIMMWLLLLRRT